MHHRDAENTEGLLDEVTEPVIGAAIEVHRALGPGLLESAYEECLAFELSYRGLRVDRQRSLPLRYKSRLLDCAYRMDLVVQESVVVEVKSVERLEGIHSAQLLTYLQLSGFRVNFNVPVLRCGLRRLIHGSRCPRRLGGDWRFSMKWTLVLALAVGQEETEVWVFFSPASPDASGLLRSFGDVPVRPALLVENYATGLEPSGAFLATIAAAGPVRAADDEALALAARLGIRELPAAAVRRGARWHVAAGTDVDGKELLRCSR